MSESNTYFKAFKYCLYPTPAQERQLFLVLKVCRHWHNMCVSERTWACKAVSAGCEVITVKPAYTSKCCSNCGMLFQDFDLSTHWVDCDCGLALDCDHNAAINILNRALMQDG